MIEITEFAELAQRYIDTWNETDPQVRQRLAEQLFTAEARYIDPVVAAEGPAAIAATIDAVQQQFPGYRFRLLGEVDAHHDQARFSWALGRPNEEAIVIGSDVVVGTASGQLSLILGFLDKVPQPA